jgi:hypothetical protein
MVQYWPIAEKGARSATNHSVLLLITLTPCHWSTAVRIAHLAAIAFLLSPGLARAADTQTDTVSLVGDLASLLEGEFTTQPAPDDSTVGAKTVANIYYELAKRVEVPTLGHDVVYAELRQGGADGKILRQRLYALKTDDQDGAITMTTYEFANGAELAGSETNRTPLAKLAPSDLKPVACKVSWRKTEAGFEGTVAPQSCPTAPAKSDGPVVGVSKTALSMPVDSDVGPPSKTFRRLR